MELRHLDTLLAIAETGSFTAAADELRTVQSNVSETVRQLEAELGAPLLVRGRRGAVPTESGQIVIERAQRIRRELSALRNDIAMVQGLQRGDTSVGVVGTASRWLIPGVVEELHAVAPGVQLRVVEGASERLAAAVVAHELSYAIVTEPVSDHRLAVEHLLDEALIGVAPEGMDLPPEPVSFARVAETPLILPPRGNPLRVEIEAAAAFERATLHVPLEVDGVRLIVDLVAAGVGVSILPETALPQDVRGVQRFRVANLLPRRLALVHARDAQMSRADEAARTVILQVVGRPRREA